METYRIRLRGQVDVEALNQMSPHQMTIIKYEGASTLLSIYTDQSGVIGMVRHLHNQGCFILAVSCLVGETNEWKERIEP
jgi:hypothetical protein